MNLYRVNDGSSGPQCWATSRREAARMRASLRRTCGWDCAIEEHEIGSVPLPVLAQVAAGSPDPLVRRAAEHEIAKRGGR